MVARPVIPSRLTGGAAEHIRRNSALSVDVLNRLDNITVPVWTAANQLPASPGGGEIGVVRFSTPPAGGNGLYYHDGTGWFVVTAASATLP